MRMMGVAWVVGGRGGGRGRGVWVGSGGGLCAGVSEGMGWFEGRRVVGGLVRGGRAVGVSECVCVCVVLCVCVCV